ncbi:MAG: DEAD/DEAH box helicase [Deltaproteobacteria bacterium]|nr:DEAD/DEAH box helicase [Deltaproteobacteria bacterium]
MNGSRTTADLRELIPHSWHGFLARFGTPTKAQTEAIPAIMTGRSVLLVAPTAGGKTEAFAAPIAERILTSAGSKELMAWIVCPTRALVNDLARRLEPPLRSVGLRLGRRTGEHREITSRKPPHVVITTPESLDSMLTRSVSKVKKARYLVLDEVHLLDASPRGNQLACLVSRIARLAPHVQVIASSATIHSPDSVAKKYLGPGSEQVIVPGRRIIETTHVRGGASGLAETLTRLTTGKERIRKVLAFTRRRADAERFCGLFKGRPPFGDAVFLHHGSLSRSTREEVEKRLLNGTAGLCFATSTMEVGIDIGDVDLVVLMSPPPDVSSLLQRIGRGNRRSEVTRVCCLSRDEGDVTRYDHMIAAARDGRLLGDNQLFCPSVLVQQCLSLLMQTPGKWINADSLASRMPAWLSESSWIARLDELLFHLAAEQWLLRAGDRYSPEDKLEEAFHKGLVHSNIQDTGDVEVVDRDTKKLLGTVHRRAASERKFLLGGRKLEVVAVEQHSKLLVVDAGGRVDMKVGAKTGPSIPERLTRDLAAFIGIEQMRTPVMVFEDGSATLFHFLGSTWSRLMKLVLEQKGKQVISGNPVCTVVAGDAPSIPTDLTLEELEAIAKANWPRLAHQLPTGPWFSLLPPDWRKEHVMDLLDLKRFKDRLRGFGPNDYSIAPEKQSILSGLARGQW